MDHHSTNDSPMEIDTPNNTAITNNENLNLEDMMEKKRNKMLLQEQIRENMVTSGFIFIREFLKLLKKMKASDDDLSKYMQKVLHAIFFLGHINDHPISPQDFIPNTLQTKLQEMYPKPFREYKTHPPRQTPYSILLEYMENTLNTEDPDSFVNQLVKVNESLWKLKEEEGNQPIANDFSFTASVVSYSFYKDPNPNTAVKKAFGSSISCRGKVPRRIMIAISALYVWDVAISYAVVNGKTGPAIMFPDNVHCQAYSFSNKERKYSCISPCTKCDCIYKNLLFNPEFMKSEKNEDWPYGNCAETESLSKLLLRTPEVQQGTKTMPDKEGNSMYRDDIEKTFTAQKKQKLIKDTIQLLRTRNITVKQESWTLFTPD